jgi:hypothetical protein
VIELPSTAPEVDKKIAKLIYNRAYDRARYRKNPDRYKETRKAYRAKNRDKILSQKKTYVAANRQKRRRWYLKFKYGLSLEQFNEIFDAQDRKCAICKTSNFTGRNNMPAIDHCHDAGHVRGILCDPCNRALGLFKHSHLRLSNALKYLAKELLFTQDNDRTSAR